MILLSRRSLLAVAAVVDVALHARPSPVAAKALAARHDLPPRHLETMLQDLVRAGVLKGVRGPRGGYELARERRRISAGDVVRAVMNEVAEDGGHPSRLVAEVIEPAVTKASGAFLEVLDSLTIEELCADAEARGVFDARANADDYTI